MAAEDNVTFSGDAAGSVSKPMSNVDLANFIRDSLSASAQPSTTGTFTSEGRTTFNLNGFVENTVLTDRIAEAYAKALESVGLNFVDPLQAYSTCFNRNMQTLGLDPQRPGNSYVFFTRPDLNLSPENIAQIPAFAWFMKTEIGNLVGNYLQYPNRSLETGSGIVLDSKFKTDSVFDPLMTNTCKSLSGLKDMSMALFETEGDFSGHQLQYAMGSDGYDTIGEFSATFEDSYGSPMFIKHFIWFLYMHEVCKGTISPMMKYIRERVIDYTCSAYVFKLGEDNKTILRFAKLTGCFPVSVPLDTLNHNRDMKPDEFDEINISYAYNAYEPMNPNLIKDFNKIAMTSAFVDGTDLSKLGDGKTVFRLRDQVSPDKLISGYPSTPERKDSIWARTPVIIGNQLLFV